MLSSSLDTLLKVSKTTYSKNYSHMIAYRCILDFQFGSWLAKNWPDPRWETRGVCPGAPWVGWAYSWSGLRTCSGRVAAWFGRVGFAVGRASRVGPSPASPCSWSWTLGAAGGRSQSPESELITLSFKWITFFFACYAHLDIVIFCL